MTSTRRFPDHDERTAPDAARPALAATRAQWGGIPTPVARLAESPAALSAATAALEAFEHTRLAPIEREVVAMTVAREHGCRFCLGLHTKLLGHFPDGAATARTLAAGERLADPRLAALQAFVERALATRGDLDAPTWDAFLAAGFTHADALDVIVGIGAYTLTTFANRLTQA
jgi:alkylhydroperoxidase family enzyme